MALLPSVDPEVCAGRGECLFIAPQVFTIEVDVASVIGTGPDELILEAARACPSQAITVTDAQTGAQVHP
jgi:ferredoxin